MSSEKKERLLEVFFRAIRGEDLSVSSLAEEYNLSSKSISRDFNEIKTFLADHRELVGNSTLEYHHAEKTYRLHLDDFLSDQELFALVKVMIGSRAFSKMELLELIQKLKRFAAPQDRAGMNEMIRNELYHYCEVKHDCESVTENLWKLAGCIRRQKEISISYYKMDRAYVEHRLIPASLMFTDYYFYLIAFHVDDERQQPYYFRVDRIKSITEHRQKRSVNQCIEFDEGLLRQRSLFMWPGSLRTIRFEFTGPSVQAVLDKLPTAKIIERDGNGKYLIEAEVYGDGIRMWLLSQGSWVKVVAPEEYVNKMKEELLKLSRMYETHT